ncbi:MAG: DUF3244 domain-containing protein [Bacteroidales bacterium]|nr:DUF3244 domain-containing protein [Bacteroidales bacterium]
MKTKLFSLFLAVLLSFTFSNLKADDPPKVKIPLEIITTTVDDHRSIITLPIECHYLNFMSSIQTTTTDNIGEITVEVLNTTTGEYFNDTFSSSVNTLHILPISGSSGFYSITYTTSLGGEYVGTFIFTD